MTSAAAKGADNGENLAAVISQLGFDLRAEYDAANAAGDGEIFAGAVSDFAAGKVNLGSISNLLSQVGQVGGTALCAALGAGAASPLCAAAGQKAAEVLTSFFGEGAKGGPGGGEIDPAFGLENGLVAKKDAVRQKVLPMAAGDPEIAKTLFAIIDAFYDTDFWAKPGPEGMMSRPLMGGYFFGSVDPHWIAPQYFGPMVTKGNNVERAPAAGGAPNTPPGWREGFIRHIISAFGLVGVNLAAYEPVLLQEFPPGAPGNYGDVLSRMQLYFFPELDLELSRRLRDVLATAAIERQAHLLEVLEALSDAIAEQRGCKDDACRAAARQQAAAVAEAAKSGSTSALQKAIAESTAPPGGSSSKSSKSSKSSESAAGRWGRRLLWGTALTGVAVGAVAGVRVYQGKPAIPPAVSRQLARLRRR